MATAQANQRRRQAGNIRAEADVTRWQSQYARISQLVAGGSLDRKLEDETRDSLKAAEAARGEARAKVDAAKAALCCKARPTWPRPRPISPSPAPGRQCAEADLCASRPCSSTRRSAPPTPGVVTERNVIRGDFVQPAGTMTAKPLLAVARTDVVRIFVDVPEMESPWVEAGRPGYVHVQALPDRVVEGKVTRTSWVLGPNRTLRTELDLPNPEGLLRPGMYATAHIGLQERRRGVGPAAVGRGPRG